MKLVKQFACVVIVLCIACMSAAAAAPLYTVGGIPPMEVRQNTTLSFQIQSPQLGVASFACELDPGYPAPQGQINLNTFTGLFTYTPAAADKFEFRITFSSTVAGKPPDTQSVLITPIVPLLPETDLIRNTAAVPDGAGADYRVVSQAQNSASELLNGTQRQTWNVEITGKSVVFDSSILAPGALYARFHNRPDVKSMTIYAEELIVRSPLKLPGTNLTVYARRLSFEDTSGQALIDTTPLGFDLGAAQFQDGLPGQKGGDIILHVQGFVSQPGPTVRFISRGGNGQEAGQGAPGNPGSPSFTFPTPCCPITGYIPLTPTAGKPYSNLWVFFNEFPWLITMQGPVVRAASDAGCSTAARNSIKTAQSWKAPNPNAVFVQVFNGNLGSQVWPGDGNDGRPGGRPGDAGPGGTISSSLPGIQEFVDQAGGAAGAQAAVQAGGAAGQPNPAVWITSLASLQVGTGVHGTPIFQTFYCATSEHSSQPGRDSVPLEADIATGASGAFTALTDQAAQWLHPYFLRMVVLHAKDAYRSGNLNFAKQVFTDYLDALNQYGTPPPDFALPFTQLQQEMTALLVQIDQGVDYFGNGPGWVPFLSLPATMQAFSNEVDVAVPMLYVSRYLQNKADQNQKDVAALQDSIAKLSGDVAQTSGDVNKALLDMPSLQFQAAQIAEHKKQLETALQNRESELLQEATNNVEESKKVPFIQKAVRVLGAIAQAVPAKVPGFQAIGAGLSILGNIDNKTSWETILGGAGDLADGVQQFDVQTTTAALSNALKSIDPATYHDNALLYAKALSDAARQVTPVFENARKVLEDNQISDAEVRAEFDKIRATDGALNDLIQQCSDLQAEKAAFDQALQQTLQTISNGTAKINQDLTSIAAVYQTLDSTAGQVDHGLLVQVRDMELRARERLLHYHYYMARAYEYRMLQPYPGDLNIDSTINQILGLLDNAYPADLSLVKAAYIDSVRRIIFSALEQFQTQPPDVSLPFFFKLEALQLHELNETGQVTVDLAPLIAGLPNEDNRHIADLGVSNINVQTVGPLGAVARVRIVVNHMGQSIETLNGQRFQFYFGSSPNDQAFTFGDAYNLPNGPLSHETPSISGLSLLQAMLNIPGPIDPLMLFARPGADAVVTINRFFTPSSLNAQINNLEFFVTVDFSRTSSNHVNLSVGTTNGNLPYVAIDRNDITGRNDGAGTFQRTYNLGDRVTLTAEPMYQGFKFLDWVDDRGNVLSTSTTLILTLTESFSVHPVYDLPAIANPVPLLNSISPASAIEGANDITLILNGSGFTNSSVVRWNGKDRNTAYFNKGQLSAALTSSDLAAVGNAFVTVFNPLPGGGVSKSLPFRIIPAPNPIPVIAALSPAIVKVGSGPFLLTVNGSGFVQGAGVLLNGADRRSTTSWISESQLTVPVSSSDIAISGTADVTVSNPQSSGGGLSPKFKLVIDSASDSPGVFTVTATTAALSVERGQSEPLQVSFSGLPSGTNVIATCANLPAGASCSYNNANQVVTLSTLIATPPGDYSIAVIFNTAPQAAMKNRPFGAKGGSPVVLGRAGIKAWFRLGVLLVGLCWLGSSQNRKRHSIFLLALCLLLASASTLFSGCGGGSPEPTSTPKSVNAAQSSLSLVLTVK